jgi:aminopeptidase N
MSSWRHLWLAEGFATYAEWMWSGAHHTGNPQQLFRATYASYPRADSFWRTAVTHPDFALSNEGYDRGAMFLQALRHVIGTSAFFRVLRLWGRVHRHGNASTADFQALAELVSGRQLDHLVQVWLHSRSRPAPTARNGFPESMTKARVRSGSAPASFAQIRRTDRMLSIQPSRP